MTEPDEPEMVPMLPWQQWMMTQALARALDSAEPGLFRVEILCLRSKKENPPCG